MKVIIAGSRTLHEKHDCFLVHLRTLCKRFESDYGEITVEVSGKAPGPDRIGEKWARENNIPIAMFPAQWDQYGKAAGAIRNTQMGEYADGAIIMWDGESKGSKQMANVMRKLGKPYILEVFQPIVEFAHQPTGQIEIKRRYGL